MRKWITVCGICFGCVIFVLVCRTPMLQGKPIPGKVLADTEQYIIKQDGAKTHLQFRYIDPSKADGSDSGFSSAKEMQNALLNGTVSVDVLLQMRSHAFDPHNYDNSSFVEIIDPFSICDMQMPQDVKLSSVHLQGTCYSFAFRSAEEEGGGRLRVLTEDLFAADLKKFFMDQQDDTTELVMDPLTNEALTDYVDKKEVIIKHSEEINGTVYYLTEYYDWRFGGYQKDSKDYYECTDMHCWWTDGERYYKVRMDFKKPVEWFQGFFAVPLSSARTAGA